MARLPHRERRRGYDHAQPQVRRKLILVIEDNGIVGGLVAGLLRQDGYRVLRACDSREAARLVRGRAPQLIVLDVALSYPEGLDALRLLRAQVPHLPPVVLVTASSVALAPADEALVQEVVTRPFDIDVLLNAARRALNDPVVDIQPRQYDEQDYFLHGY